MNFGDNGKQESNQSVNLTALALGELPEAEQKAIELLLNQQPELAADVDQLRRLGVLVRDSSNHELDRLACSEEVTRLKHLIDNSLANDVGQPVDAVVPLKSAAARTSFWTPSKLTAIAATLLLAAGIAFVVLRPPILENNGLALAESGEDVGEVERLQELRVPSRPNIEFQTDSLDNGIRVGSVEKTLGDYLGREEAENDVLLRDALDEITDSIAPIQAGLEPVAPQPQPKDLPSLQVLDGDFAAGDSTTRGVEQQMQLTDGVTALGLTDEKRDIKIIRDSEFRRESEEGRILAVEQPGQKGNQTAPANSPNPVVLNQLKAPPQEDINAIQEQIQLARNAPVPAQGQDSNGNDSNGNGRPVETWQYAGERRIPPAQRPDIESNAADGEILERQQAIQDLMGEQLAQRAEFETRRKLALVETDRYGYGRDHDDEMSIQGFALGKNQNEQYELPPENQFFKPLGDQALSTFSIDVDTASYANVRRFVTSRQLPPPAAVRVEEMVNYFSYGYSPPTDGRPFAVSMETAQCPWQPAHQLLRVGIKGQEIQRDDRPPSNLVFLIDVSGSMKDANKLPLLQRAMLLLVDQLTENDQVSIVTYANNAGVRLQPVSGDQKQKIRDVIHGLSANGSTHGSAGIQSAYDLASEHFIEDGTNRVMLATDGDLNVGVTDDDQLVQLIKGQAERGIFLSVMGFGTGNLKDAKLEKIADNGNGHYSYIDSIHEAQKVLVAGMSGNLITIAKDVKLQIEFNPAEIAGYRLIGYENRALKNQDFANDQIDAGEIGAGHTVTALYELVPVGATAPASATRHSQRLKYQAPAEPSEPESTDTDANLSEAANSGELLTLFLRYKQPMSDTSELMELPVSKSSRSFDEASVDFRFAASVAALGMQLRQSVYSGLWQLSDIENAAAAALGDDAQGHRAEFVDLVRQVRQLTGR